MAGNTEEKSFLIGRWLYLRVLGICFAASFLSLAFQIQGLAGPQGIFPAAPAWSLRLLWVFGLVGASLVVLNRWNRAGLLLCLACFLWFVRVAPYFSWYRADNLFLEGAFLALFLAPKGARPEWGHSDPPSHFVWWMHLFLLFRLMLETGLSKLFGGDPAWRDLSAMEYFFETCPFPAAGGWLLHQVGGVLPQILTAYTLFVESVCPFLLFLGGRGRLVAVGAWIILQVGILFSGNFMAFNYNAIGLALLMVDDGVWTSALRRFFPAFPTSPVVFADGLWKRRATQAVLGVHGLLAVLLLLSFPVFPGMRLPGPLSRLAEAASRTRLVNQYILFPVVMRERRVVFFEGSNDGGATWREYPLRWQPQALDRMPRYFAPYQPRFDRELLRLAEVGGMGQVGADFIHAVAERLLEGSQPVLALFAGNPFREKAPNRIRAVSYRYRLTDFETLRTTGRWWERERLGVYGAESKSHP